LNPEGYGEETTDAQEPAMLFNRVKGTDMAAIGHVMGDIWAKES
jgi:hypothetical protein